MIAEGEYRPISRRIQTVGVFGDPILACLCDRGVALNATASIATRLQY